MCDESTGSAAGSVTEDPPNILGPESDEIRQLVRRTGYPLRQENGQRRYGPPADWTDSPPGRGCEVFVGKLPRDCFENEIVPVFERFGRIYEVYSLYVRNCLLHLHACPFYRTAGLLSHVGAADVCVCRQ